VSPTVPSLFLTGVASNAYLCVWPDIYWCTDLLRVIVSAGPGAASAQQRLQQLESLEPGAQQLCHDSSSSRECLWGSSLSALSSCDSAQVPHSAHRGRRQRYRNMFCSKYLSDVSAAVFKQKQMLRCSLTGRT
jgi:hypothetical protein